MSLTFSTPDIENYLRTFTISHFTVNKDETQLVFSSNLNGKFNLWAMDLPSTFPYPLTFNNQASAFVKSDPHKRFLLTGFDKDGDENYQIFSLPVQGGRPEPLLTGEAHEKFYFAHLSEDGQRLYYMTSRENPTFLNTRVLDLESGEDQVLIQGEGGATYLNAVSPNEKHFAYHKSFANTYSLGFCLTTEGDIHCLTPDETVVHITSDMTFISDTEILFLTNYDEEFTYLASFDVKSNTFKPLHKIEREDILSLKWHAATNTAYLVTEKGVADYLYAYNFETKNIETISLPVDTVQQLHVSSQGNLYVLGRSATASFNLYKKEVDSKDWVALTSNPVPGLTKEELIDPDVITYPSFDGMAIEALLFRPKASVANGYTIFWPHGGPQSAERKWFRGAFQFLLGQGYQLFAPNFRGSTGYGASFTKLVERDWGEGPRLDCVAGIEWLFENGHADREKLFLFGGSYGGYMTLLLAGRHPEYFKACVDIFGPSNLFTFIESVPDHWKPIMERWLGDPIKDKERLDQDSPITYLKSMTKPMLVIQGANDPRVVKQESDQIVDELKKQGTEVEYLVFDDEGHGFAKKENEIKAYRAVLHFLEKHRLSAVVAPS